MPPVQFIASGCVLGGLVVVLPMAIRGPGALYAAEGGRPGFAMKTVGSLSPKIQDCIQTTARVARLSWCRRRRAPGRATPIWTVTGV
jgi:hypothetical protein